MASYRPIEVSCEVSLLSLAGYRRLMERAGFVNIRTIDSRNVDLDRGKLGRDLHAVYDGCRCSTWSSRWKPVSSPSACEFRRGIVHHDR